MLHQSKIKFRRELKLSKISFFNECEAAFDISANNGYISFVLFICIIKIPTRHTSHSDVQYIVPLCVVSYIVSYRIVLYRITSYRIKWYHIALYCIMSYCIILYCTVSYGTELKVA